MTDDLPPEDENKLIAERRAKLDKLRERGPAFPNDFRRNALAEQLHTAYGERPAEWFEKNPIPVQVGGRLMAKRIMGKASFAKVLDRSGQIQLFLQSAALGDVYEEFKSWDVGDLLGAEGVLFKTKTGELSVKVEKLRLLTKSLRPLPDKWHGLADQEVRYRQRYVDLIINEESRQVFRTRTRIIKYLRNFLDAQDYIEVETPMLQVIPGGAAARPFVTHHNALDLDMYLRIAPELYLKRLVVGGFERVYEINRNFRNEGVSTRHNPEFTMLELYQAYATYNEIMDITEEMIRTAARDVVGKTALTWEGREIDVGSAFRRWKMEDAVLEHNPQIARADIRDRAKLAAHAQALGVHVKADYGWGKILLEIFEKTVEGTLVQPTFITTYPTEVSPLARANDHDPEVTDRFELFIGAKELANGFSELNDPEDQAERFRAQVSAKDSGDDEAMHFDADYIRALEVGLPPTGGLGVGIDRLVMLLADVPSIRDVLLFPYMRPNPQ